MDFPIENGGSFHSYVSLPEGTQFHHHFPGGLALLALFYLRSSDMTMAASPSGTVFYGEPGEFLWDKDIIPAIPIGISWD